MSEQGEDRTNERKIEHIRAIERDPATDRDGRWFDRIMLEHRALPELSLEAVDPGVQFLGKRLDFPLLISSMTGGDHERVRPDQSQSGGGGGALRGGPGGGLPTGDVPAAGGTDQF